MEDSLINNEIAKTVHNLLKMKDDSQTLKQLTNEEWQEILSYLKSITIPSSKKILRRNVNNIVVVRTFLTLTDTECRYDTLDSIYVKYINDVLGQIRKGYTDYCYHTYQIVDLLRFEPMLNTRLESDGKNTHFEVWLDKNN